MYPLRLLKLSVFSGLLWLWLLPAERVLRPAALKSGAVLIFFIVRAGHSSHAGQVMSHLK